MSFTKENPDKRTGYWCADCGAALRFNVPRLGPDGGFIHDETNSLFCLPQPVFEWPERPARTSMNCRVCGNFSSAQTCWHCATNPAAVRASQLEAMLVEVLAHPYPHDLLDIRRRVREEYSKNEEEAKEYMEDGYCTEQCALDAYLKHKEVHARAREMLKPPTAPIA